MVRIFVRLRIILNREDTFCNATKNRPIEIDSASGILYKTTEGQPAP